MKVDSLVQRGPSIDRRKANSLKDFHNLSKRVKPYQKMLSKEDV